VVSATCGGLPDDVVAAYDAPFPTAGSTAGALAFPRLVPTSPGDPGAAGQKAVRDALDGWDVPVTVAFSDADPIFPSWYGEAGARRLRRAEFTLIEGAGHYVPEQQPLAVARAILG
jgi:haloalkane dehalogenase